MAVLAPLRLPGRLRRSPMQDAGAPERGGVASNRDGARVRASGSWGAICSQEGDASYRRPGECGPPFHLAGRPRWVDLRARRCPRASTVCMHT